MTLTIAVENARRISEWTPTEEEKALLKPEEGARPATPQTAMTEEEKRIMADAQAAKAAGRPFGIRKDTIWVHDHFYTEDGISLPPYYGEDEEENGTLYEIREFSPLPEDVSGRETLSVYAELGRSTEYYYFDGQKTYWRSEVQRDGVGRVTATVPKAEAEIILFTGEGTLNGAACTVTAQVSAIELRLTIDAETDAFPLTTAIWTARHGRSSRGWRRSTTKPARNICPGKARPPSRPVGWRSPSTAADISLKDCGCTCIPAVWTRICRTKKKFVPARGWN